MLKAIKIGTALASFMEGTDFSQSHFSHTEEDRHACYDCEELTAEQYQAKRGIYMAASKGAKLIPTAYQLQELLDVADCAQDMYSYTGDFADAARGAGVRRSMDSWERDAKSNGYKVNRERGTHKLEEVAHA
jgi:hypothetical protein